MSRAILAVLAMLWFWLTFIWSWRPGVFMLTFDDSYYYFEIARNLATGHGSTFDRINPTNGYHPLWMAICIVPYLFEFLDPLDPVRVLVTVQLVWFAAALAIAIQSVRRTVATIVHPEQDQARHSIDVTLFLLVALIAGNPSVVKTYANGLESGIYLLAYAVLLAVADWRAPRWLDPSGTRDRLTAAGLLTLTVLARTDAALLLPCIALWYAPELWRRGRAGLRMALELLGLPAGTVLLFMVANRVAFGAWMQVSGELKRVAPTPLRLLWVAACLAVPVAVAVVARRSTGARLPRLVEFVRRTGWFLAFAFVLVAYYTGVQTFARLWYFGPPAWYALLLLLLLAVDLSAMALADRPQEPAKATLAPVRWILALPLVAGLFLLGRQTLDPRASTPLFAAAESGAWMSDHLPLNAVLGSWDAGAIGYFTEQRVINLDGVVNAPAYVDALRGGTTSERLLGQGVQYIVNHDDADGGDASMREATVALLGEPAVAGWIPVKTWPFVFRGSSNRRGIGEHSMAIYLFALPGRTDEDLAVEGAELGTIVR